MDINLTLVIGAKDTYGIFKGEQYHTVWVDGRDMGWDSIGAQLQHELADLIFKAKNAKGSMDDA